MKRTREIFDSGWRFHKNELKGADQAAFDDSAWRSLDLPHDWSIEGPFSEKNRSMQSLAYLPGGIGWYRKTFALLPEDRGKRIFIEFDGVFRCSDIWINGYHLGFFPDGYTSFQYELTQHVVFDRENTVAVRVDNSQQPNSRWYTGSGIYRHVWLTKTSPVYIVKDTTYITTPIVSAEECSMHILMRIQNGNIPDGSENAGIRDESDAPVGYMVNLEIFDAAGTRIAEKSDARYIDPGSSERFSLSLWVNSVHLWDINDPYLYTARFSVYEGEDVKEDKLLDMIEVPFGYRSIEFHKDNGFFLNGRRVKIQGVAVHHEAGLLGAAVPEKVWERRLRKLRDMGCNAIRNAHSAAAPELLDMCDRIGLMVFDEVFDEWKLSYEKNHSVTHSGISKTHDSRYGSYQYWDEWGYKNMAATVRRDRNHPCVVIWGIGNEICEQSENDGHIIAGRLNDVCHAEDPTRPTMTANHYTHNEIPGFKTKIDFLEATDMVGYNHIQAWGTVSRRLYFEDKYEHPGWKVMGSENANIFSYRGHYTLESDNFMVKPYFMAMLDAEDLWKFTKLYDYVMGDFLWAGIDYLGEWPWPLISAPCGLLDTCGFEKDSYYFFKSQWSDKPVIKLLPHWNWPGQEGKPIPVVCYTNCDEVELFANGQSLGKQAYNYFRLGATKNRINYSAAPRRVTTNDLHLMWVVPYKAGELRAVGTKNGQVFEDVVRTCGPAANVELSVDRTEIKADNNDICHVEVKILDSEGVFVPFSNDRLKFAIEGPGEVLCLDSGSPSSHEIGLHAGSINAYNGMCIAYIRACKPGSIRLTVSGDGIAPQSISIKAI